MAERLELLDDPPPLAILPIYSQMPADLQAKIFLPTADGRRKVVVATNIAETSLTGVSYVPQCLRNTDHPPSRRYSIRGRFRLQQAEGLQSQGRHGCLANHTHQPSKLWPADRSGRQDGTRVSYRFRHFGRSADVLYRFCYRLFTETAYLNELFANNIPEIQRTNLANTVLLLKTLGVKNLLEFDFMDPPPQVSSC